MKKLILLSLLYLFIGNFNVQAQKILFDCTKAESDGNADWVIDADSHNIDWGTTTWNSSGNESNPQQTPTLAQSGITGSTSETYWQGGNSAWAVELVKLGYTVETLPPTGLITYGDGSNTQDLLNYKVFVINEPNIQFSASEMTALMNFIQNGGGLFIISDHDNSDRNSSGMDSPHIWNDFFSNNGVQANPFGITFDYVTITDNPTTNYNTAIASGDPLLEGPVGTATSMGFNGSATMTISTAANSSVLGVFYQSGVSLPSANQVLVAYATYGSGRVVAISDSSPFDDGTGDSNDVLYNNWADGNNAELILNATVWLANAPSGPVLSVTPASLTGFTYIEGSGPSTSQSYVFSGSSLDGTDLSITAPADYEVSFDDITFSGSLIVTTADGNYDGTILSDTTVYVRLKAGLTAGTYNSELITNSGGGASDVTILNDGTVTTNAPSTCEDFNDQSGTAYGTSFTMTTGTWTCSDAGNFDYCNSNMGSPGFTINDDKTGANITTPAMNSCGTVSFNYAYTNGTSTNVFELQTSTDGTNFTTVDTHTLGASSNLNWVFYSFDVNDASNPIYIRILSDSQDAHLFIDDFCWTTYSGSGAEVDWGNLQWPASGSIKCSNEYTVYAQVYEPGITDMTIGLDTDPNLLVWVGYSTTDTDPSTWTNWVPASGNPATNDPSNDEYMADIGTSLTGGTYYYASRFQVDGGPYKYGGYNGGFWDGTANVSGTLTVDGTPDWYNLQSPENGSVTLGTAFDVYAQVYESGITDAAGQGSGILAWIGYGTVDNDPTDPANAGDWTWVPASYNTDSGNNDEYTVNLESVIGATGTYYYVSRFQIGSCDFFYGGYNGGAWSNTYASGTGNKSGQLIITTPTLTVNPLNLTGFTYVEGSGPSSSQIYTFSGSDLNGTDLTITAPADYEISFDDITFSGSLTVTTADANYDGTTLSATTVYVRLKAGLTAGTYNSENITNSGGGASAVTVSNDGTVTTAGACATDLIISQINENGNDKYIEIANFTGTGIDLSNYDIVLYTNGNTTPSSPIALTSAILADGDVWVLANSLATVLTPSADQTSGSFTPNGNDVIALRKSGSNIDVFGTIGDGSYWYNDQQYIRNADITDPTTSYNVSEWTVTAYGGGDPGSLGTHTMSCTCEEPTTEASNLSFSNVSDVSMDLSWTSGNGLSRIVVAKEGGPVDWVPADGSTYTANASFGSGTELGTGNYIVYNGSASGFSLTNLSPGTTYYFKIFEYGCTPGTEDYLTSGASEEGNETTLPNDVTNFTVDCAAATSVNLSWTLPAGNYDGIMIAVLPDATPDDPTCAGNTLIFPNTDFSSADVYCANASGAVYVYNNVGTSVTVTGLTNGTSYHFKAFTYINSAWSSGSEIIQTAEVSDVTGLYASCGNGESALSWTNPSASCFDEVIVAVNTASITGIPSGTYTANSTDYTDGTNPTLSDGSRIVYNGTTSPQTISGLTNGTNYYFKVFVRSGTDWSAGSEVSCAATTASYFDYGDLAIVGINTHYIDYDNNLSDDEIQFVCFKDITTETSIDFTDNGYERLYPEKWGDTEGTITLTRTGADIPAGTVITVRGVNAAANWHVFIGSGTSNGSLTNDDANWVITDGGAGNNVFDLNSNDQIWMMQGGVWDNPAGLQNATYSGKILYGWTAIGWEPSPGYNLTSGSTIFTSSACSVTNLVGVPNEDKVRYDGINTVATQRDWISRFNDEQRWTGYADSTAYQNGGTLPDVISISTAGFSGVYKWTGETSSDWDDCTNWLNLKVPDASADVQFVSDDCFNDLLVLPGQTVICRNLDISGSTLNHSIKAEGDITSVIEVHGDVTIGGPAGVLDFDDGTAADDGTIKIYGNWYENTADAFSEGNSFVEFIGSDAQSIYSVSTAADFYNLKIDNSSAGGVSFENSVTVSGILNSASGIINLNGFNLDISGEFTGTNGVFAGNATSDLTVNGSGAIAYNFNFAVPQELNTFTMNRSGQTAVLATNLTMNNMQTDAGTIELSAGKYYTVNTSLSNTPGATGLILKSDATGTASLIQPSSGVLATCERYMGGQKWNYFFTPLSAVPTNIINGDGNLNFYYYDENKSDYWDASSIYGTSGWTDVSNGLLSTDMGYIQYKNTTEIYNLTGGTLYDPATGTKIFTLNYTDNGSGSVGLNGVTTDWNDFEGWNLIGNPFTSAFDWDQTVKNNVENVIYYYDGINYKYYGGGTSFDQGISVNGGSQFVPADQGFFVKATVNNGTLQIPLAARSHNAQIFWKKTQNVSGNVLKLSVGDIGFTDETVIRILPDAGEGHDVLYDAYKLFSNDKSKPMLFSRNSDNSHFYAINTLPEFSNDKIIPLGIYIGSGAYYTIRLNENSFNNTHIYLTDTELNETVNLINEDSYSFYQQAVDFSERFYIHLKKNSAPVLNNAIPDQITEINESYIYTIPENIFTDYDTGDKLKYSATTADGNKLPGWLSFDSETATFTGVSGEVQVLSIKVTATDIFGESVSDVYNLTVTSGSSVSEISENGISVYPNPTNGIFTVEFSKPVNGILSITDLSGKELLKNTINSNRTTVDLNGFTKGIFIVNINTGNQNIYKRIILK